MVAGSTALQTYTQCLSCFERQAADVCAIAKLGQREAQAILEAVQDRIASFPRERPPIEMGVEIHNLVRAESGLADPYADIKKRANAVCLGFASFLAETMRNTHDPLETATKLAIAGNIIDCGAHGLREVSEAKLMEVIQDVLAQPLKGSSVDRFATLIQGADSILYIGDNAGECFFDGPLLDLLPAGKVTYAVRGGPVLNDATLEDARAAGIPLKCPVIDTGDNAPGVLLDRCSASFRTVFENSDLIISKGQGNYESLSETPDKTIVFLTKVKCEMIAQDIGHELGSAVIKIVNAMETEMCCA